MRRHVLRIGPLALLLAAPAAIAANGSQAASLQVPASVPGGSATAAAASASPTAANLHLRCGLAEASVQPTSATTTLVSFRATSGSSPQPLAIPPGLADQTAVGVGCAVASDGSAYLVVEYGELPSGCRFCEWYALHDSRGALLSANDPPLLGTGEDREPNNRQYQAQLARLGLQHPQMQHADR